MGEPRSLLLDGGRIDYRLVRSRRKTVAIHIRADGKVELRAPLRLPVMDAEGFLRSRAGWVARKLAELAQRPALPQQDFSAGALQPYLGAWYPLQRGGGRSVALRDGQLHLPVTATCAATALREWYRRRAREVFAERLAHCHGRAAALGVPWPTLKIRVMKSRWGSCSRRGTVNLNLELIKYPLELIDYVLMHELCHFLEFNHSARFYAHMHSLLPDWRARRARLRELARQIPAFA